MNHLASTALPLIHGKDESEDLTSKVLELQEGLKDLLKRVASVHGEHDKKRDENLMLQQYIANLMNSNAVRGDAGGK
ncbi:hypothetical protein BGZ98_005813 [Dissophora globulifera]|uniref:Uncharacterized protein n=1 Tax=Dissophora globulifera TaxID=979702 RepID=A0A9P6RRN7_9FUNG|nr:hypothetical protein BGZ98_005813 [Dissophora globulifera]KAG0324952.1 hypothetical protein BGZ99_001254 [Dissophora globulifera]